MKESEILYAAAESMRKSGYAHEYNSLGCGCFLDHIHRALKGCVPADSYASARLRLDEVVGVDLRESALARAGWNKDDAIAALTIAADCAFEEEKAQ